MKKKLQKYLSGEREGFSLIELIIVIAIMAILIGVVALVVLPYLESARENRDRQTLSEVANAFKSAIATETAAKKIPNGGYDQSNSIDPAISNKMREYMDGDLTSAKAGLSSDACKTGDFYFTAKKNGNNWDVSVCIKKGNAIPNDKDGKPFDTKVSTPSGSGSNG